MESHKNGLILPKDANGHDFVEIAGIKWATMNVGANKVTDYGLYFQWGDTQGYTSGQVCIEAENKKPFARDYGDYDADRNFKKYNLSSEGKKELALEDDAVHANWGGSWRMPTTEEFQKLCDAVYAVWTTIDGVNGLLCTDKKNSSKTLFFPACGIADNGSVSGVGSYGDYWSSSLSSSGVDNAYNLDFDNGDVSWHLNGRRYGGFSVRGVLAEN